VVIEDFNDDDKELAGTQSRQETEFKLPFLIRTDYSTQDIKKEIYQSLKVLIANKASFPSLTKSKYYLDRNFQAFAFKDHYFDTPTNSVLNSTSSYRLRYRWSHKESFLRHWLFPFVRAFDPTRCEIQFKKGYTKNNLGIVSVNETRFEFRNEAEPFVDQQDAPKAPWPLEEYRKYAATGTYSNYRILPMADLVETLSESEPDLKRFELEEQFELITFRDRMHINMSNPWGSGPNPEQVFIITMDHSMIESSISPLTNKYKGKMLLEIEVEIERNTSTEVDRIIANSTAANPNIKNIVAQAKTTSLLAKALLEEDLKKIRLAIIKVFDAHKDIESLPTSYKYSRFKKWMTP
jgi:hypothetical protein